VSPESEAMNMTTFETPWCTPFFEDGISVPAKPNLVHPVENTQELLQEFETIYNTVHYTHLSPQIPSITAAVPQYKQEVFSFPAAMPNVPYYNNYVPAIVAPNPPSTTNIAREMDFVDEIVRSRCQDLAGEDSWHDDNTSSSLSYSSGLSPRSESDSCYGGSGFSDEELSGRRAKPYDRPQQDDRRSRKKEQNKNAATRYRQKKKQEIEEILVEEKKLSDVNEKLAKDYGEVKREVKYLKSLMRELFKSKGLLD